MSFIRNTKQSTDRIQLVYGNDFTGGRAYYFVEVSALKLPQFIKAIDGGDTLQLKDFGDVIVSGYGETVPSSVLETMRSRYGYAG